ncbi:hypothetical protein [Celeribacter neptunius]|uniref:Uncharacterized protein n=1 Tax=Celeribacter neptunius TaxID=588602 RepID=A0A1I3VNA4_9RHOB|nr:hypothetical protein [Celeribacter neptunius]SFJ96662.1 hypothetical protein SAMN04487991_3454 [Celeribacter neptunius]
MAGRYTRHEDHPPLSERPEEIPAECYNCARLALIRGGGEEPLWLPLPGLLSLKLALMPEAWVVADWRRGQMPLIVWAEFRPAPDRGLHQPVPCALRNYTGAAERIFPSVCRIMQRQLRAHLTEPGREAQVLPLSARS